MTKRFTKKEFERQFDELNNSGWLLVESEPAKKYAKFVKHGVFKIVGGR